MGKLNASGAFQACDEAADGMSPDQAAMDSRLSQAMSSLSGNDFVHGIVPGLGSAQVTWRSTAEAEGARFLGWRSGRMTVAVEALAAMEQFEWAGQRGVTEVQLPLGLVTVTPTGAAGGVDAWATQSLLTLHRTSTFVFGRGGQALSPDACAGSAAELEVVVELRPGMPCAAPETLTAAAEAPLAAFAAEHNATDAAVAVDCFAVVTWHVAATAIPANCSPANFSLDNETTMGVDAAVSSARRRAGAGGAYEERLDKVVGTYRVLVGAAGLEFLLDLELLRRQPRVLSVRRLSRSFIPPTPESSQAQGDDPPGESPDRGGTLLWRDLVEWGAVATLSAAGLGALLLLSRVLWRRTQRKPAVPEGEEGLESELGPWCSSHFDWHTPAEPPGPGGQPDGSGLEKSAAGEGTGAAFSDWRQVQLGEEGERKAEGAGGEWRRSTVSFGGSWCRTKEADEGLSKTDLRGKRGRDPEEQPEPVESARPPRRAWRLPGGSMGRRIERTASAQPQRSGLSERDAEAEEAGMLAGAGLRRSGQALRSGEEHEAELLAALRLSESQWQSRARPADPFKFHGSAGSPQLPQAPPVTPRWLPSMIRAASSELFARSKSASVRGAAGLSHEDLLPSESSTPAHTGPRPPGREMPRPLQRDRDSVTTHSSESASSAARLLQSPPATATRHPGSSLKLPICRVPRLGLGGFGIRGAKEAVVLGSLSVRDLE